MTATISIQGDNFRRACSILLAILVVFTLVTGSVAAQDAADEKQKLKKKFSQMANLIILVIGAVAVPNGAYGLFEWMTAGANQEKNEKGKKRIRNTFIALGGAAVIKVAVQLFTTVLGV